MKDIKLTTHYLHAVAFPAVATGFHENISTYFCHSSSEIVKTLARMEVYFLQHGPFLLMFSFNQVGHDQ